MKKWRTLLLFTIVLLILASCAGQQEQITTLPEHDTWNSQEFSDLRKRWSHIERRIISDSASASLSAEELSLLTTLFFKSVDGRNPNPDYMNSYGYVEKIIRFGGESSSEFHSWHLVLTEYASTKNMSQLLKFKTEEYYVAIDSLKGEIKLKDADVSRLERENRALRNEVVSQKEIIEKLKKLEMIMEQERMRFQ